MYLLRRLLRLGAGAPDPKWLMFDLLWGDLHAILTGQVWSVSRAGRKS
jgi:hypothetical protein